VQIIELDKRVMLAAQIAAHNQKCAGCPDYGVNLMACVKCPTELERNGWIAADLQAQMSNKKSLTLTRQGE